MRNRRWWTRGVLAAVLMLSAAVSGQVQERQGARRIAAGTAAEVAEWEALVDGFVSDRTLVLRSRYDDAELVGREHQSLAQYYRGLPVWGADITRQVDRGSTVSIFGTLYSGIDIDPAPQLTPARALEIAATVSGAALARAGDPELLVLPMLDGRFALAYRATMRNFITYFIDAADGRVLMEVSEMKDQSAVGIGRGALGDRKKVSTTQASGGFQTRDGLRPGAILTYDGRDISTANRLLQGQALTTDLAIDADNDWAQPGIVDTHVHIGWMYDYLFKTHNYRGMDGQNTAIAGVSLPRAVLTNNAFFISPPFGAQQRGGVFFGESTSGQSMSALDVVGHELMHGVVYFSVFQRTGRPFGGLIPIEQGPDTLTIGGVQTPCASGTFAGRPFFCQGGRYALVADHAGALNEGLADVFGTAAEFMFHSAGTGPMTADYLSGEDLTGLGPIRSLANPAALPILASAGVFYPDHLTRVLRFPLVRLSATTLGIANLAVIGSSGVPVPGNDSLGVHWNATVVAHAFYLAIEGGTNRTSGRTVQGVGTANRVQIERVFFRAVRDLMPSSVTFLQAGAILRQAAVDLFGASGAPTLAVSQALAAVGL